MAKTGECELCAGPGGDLLWEDGRCRVVRVTDADAAGFPGFCRIIWHEHIAEMSDLAAADAHHALDVVLATERALRRVVRPDKVNLASLGNMVPHLHWHVIPRWKDDSHFPAPIWAAARRSAGMHRGTDVAVLRQALESELSTVSDAP